MRDSLLNPLQLIPDLLLENDGEGDGGQEDPQHAAASQHAHDAESESSQSKTQGEKACDLNLPAVNGELHQFSAQPSQRQPHGDRYAHPPGGLCCPARQCVTRGLHQHEHRQQYEGKGQAVVGAGFNLQAPAHVSRQVVLRQVPDDQR